MEGQFLHLEGELVKASLLLCVALVVALMPQSIRLRIAETSSAPTNVLTAADLTFDGWIKSYDVGGTVFSYASGGGRLVSGKPHIFIGVNTVTCCTPPAAPSIYEMNVNEADIGAPNTSYGSAPTATIYSKWPDVTHNHYQTFDDGCSPVWSSANQVNPAKIFYNENNNLLYYTFIGQYSAIAGPISMTASSLDTPDPTAGVSTLVGGGWRLQTTDQYNNIIRVGQRVGDLAMAPDGKMLTGGAGYFNNQKAWGPNLYRRASWPTGSDTGGCAGATIVVGEHLLAFYPPTDALGVFSPNNFNAFTGVSTSTPIAQFNWPDSFLTYPFQRNVGSGDRINPQTFHIGSVSQNANGATIIGWFQGVHKKGMIYSMAVDASNNGQTDKTQCTTAALETYLSPGNGFLVITPHSGTWTGTMSGGTSGARAAVVQDDLAADNVISWQQNADVFTIGETITGFTSGAHGTLSSQSISGHFSTLVLSSVTGTFQVGENATGGTSGRQLHVATWTAGSGTLTGDQLLVDFTPTETISATGGGSGTLTEFHRNGVFDGGCACTASMACITGPSSSWEHPILAIYNPDDLESVAANTKTDYTVAPSSLIDLIGSPFSMTDLYYNLAVRGNAKGPGVSGGWIDTTHLKMYLFFQWQDPPTGGVAIARFSINDSAPPAPAPPFPTAWYALTALLTGWTLLKESKPV